MSNFYHQVRSRGTKNNGGNWSASEIEAVWKKGRIGVYGDLYGLSKRYDTCGHEIHKSEYGNTNSSHGWEIDHIKPTAKDGNDDLANLQPLYWETNRRKGDTFPWNCSM